MTFLDKIKESACIRLVFPPLPIIEETPLGILSERSDKVSPVISSKDFSSSLLSLISFKLHLVLSLILRKNPAESHLPYINFCTTPSVYHLLYHLL